MPGHARTPQPGPQRGRGGRTVRGNARVVVAIEHGVDVWGVQAASLGLATNTFSPMSAGRHSPGATSRGFTGDRGYGVNRWAGRSPRFAGNVQQIGAPMGPVTNPKSRRLGIGAGAAGQPGYPSTGSNGGGLGDLQALGYTQLSFRGWNW